jgi:mRNA interferase YafQ
MLEILYTNKMKRDAKLMKKRGKNMDKLTAILSLLAKREKLPERNRDHQLTGDLKDFRECHIEPDWLLIYQIIDNELILLAAGTGSHSDLLE